jgi:hypothetical protein
MVWTHVDIKKKLNSASKGKINNNIFFMAYPLFSKYQGNLESRIREQMLYRLLQLSFIFSGSLKLN